jgi:hypothetical protein
VLSYRVIPDVPAELVPYLTRLLCERRREIGTRRGSRVLSCWRQAVFALAWFRDRPDIARLGRGFGISQATACRYLAEVITALSAQAPELREALERAVAQGLPYLILDGKAVATDRLHEKTTSKKGRENDRWYSGKTHGFSGNIQALTAPRGIPLWFPVSCQAESRPVLAQFEHKMITSKSLRKPQGLQTACPAGASAVPGCGSVPGAARPCRYPPATRSPACSRSGRPPARGPAVAIRAYGCPIHIIKTAHPPTSSYFHLPPATSTYLQLPPDS